MMNMIEKVARKLEKEFGSDKGPNWNNSEKFFKEVAKAAIQAMREPTEEMINIKPYCNEFLIGNFTDDQKNAIRNKVCFEKMIDEALKDETK